MQECLYDGKYPKRAPQSIHCFCTCFCGDKTFFLGFRSMLLVNRNDPTNFSIAAFPCLTEFSSFTGESITYSIEEELPGEFVDIYALHGEEIFGVILTSQTPDQIIQLIWKLNKENESIECLIERRFSFKGVLNCRIGIGTTDSKCILIIGKSSVENGEALVTQSIAANPLQISKYPDRNFDKEIAELEQLCKNHPNEYLLIPNCVPFINDTNLVFETEFIGSIRLTKNGCSNVEIITVKGDTAVKSIRKMIERDLLVGWCSYVTQRKTTAWMSFVVQKASGHWRYKLQHFALIVCGIVIRYIGQPLVSLSWLDGGFMANIFAKFYMWLVPGLVPNFGPTPDLVLLALDLKNWQFRHIPFLGNETEFRSLSSQIMVDSASNGNLITTEVAPHSRRMRVSRLSNPFRIKPLYETAFEAASELIPSLSKNPSLLRLQNIYNSGGCTLFSSN
uniref:Uncharacterized protein n=1 Tax=Panagrolaimus sp. ES5 TaxID=591445 RepID=A0AC34FCC0_9BILA